MKTGTQSRLKASATSFNKRLIYFKTVVYGDRKWRLRSWMGNVCNRSCSYSTRRVSRLTLLVLGKIAELSWNTVYSWQFELLLSVTKIKIERKLFWWCSWSNTKSTYCTVSRHTNSKNFFAGDVSTRCQKSIKIMLPWENLFTRNSILPYDFFIIRPSVIRILACIMFSTCTQQK